MALDEDPQEALPQGESRTFWPPSGMGKWSMVICHEFKRRDIT